MQGEFQKTGTKDHRDAYTQNLNKFKVVATQYHPLNVLFKTEWREKLD